MAIVFVLAGPLIGLGTARLASSVERERAYRACAEYFAVHKTAFTREVQETTDELTHLASLFLVSRQVSRDQFQVFSRDILARHPAIAVLEWAPLVSADGRAAHERLGRAAGFRDYRIMALGADGSLAVSPARPEYYPVFYVEPLEPNRRALGLDLFSDRARREAMLRAAASRMPALTGPVTLVRDGDRSRGFLAVLPVFTGSRDGSAPAGDRPDGFVVLVLRAGDLFDRILDVPGAEARDMRFDLFETGPDGRDTLLDSTRDGDRATLNADWHFAERFQVGGRHWLLTGRPAEAYVSAYLSRNPLILGVGVMLLWASVGGLAVLLVARSRDVAFGRQTRVFEVALRSLAEGVIVADAQGHFVLFNDEAQSLLGMQPPDVGVSEWSSAYGCYYPDGVTPFPPQDLPLARALGGEVSTAEIVIRNASLPHGVWLTVSGTPLRDEEGALDGGIAVFRDITAARQAEHELRASLKQLEDLRYAVDQATLVGVTNRAGEIVEVNDKFCEVSGYSRAELIGRNHRMFKSGYHPAAFYHELWQTISTGRVWRRRICNRAKDGRQFWVDTTIVPLLTDGKPERYLALRTDITEQMRQEAELVRLSNAVEQTADAIMITAPDGVIQYANPAFETVTGYSRAEAIGQTPRLFRSGQQPTEYYETLWRTVLSGDVFRGSPINRRKNGELYRAEQTITPIKDSEGRIEHFVSVIKDVTDRHRAEQQELEMRYASAVQRRLYPRSAPTIAGLDIAAATFPALATCGDYYDYLQLADGSLGVVIGDVAGHGLGPALIMVETRACLHFLAQSCATVGEILTRTNSTLFEDLDDEGYVALILAKIDPSARRLLYANAGHTAAYHLDGRGNVKAVMESSGPPAGILPGVSYGVIENPPLEDGDVVVFLTDGITETEDPSGHPFGAEAAIEVIRAHIDEPAQMLIEHVRNAAREFARGAAQADDITLLVCKKVYGAAAEWMRSP